MRFTGFHKALTLGWLLTVLLPPTWAAPLPKVDGSHAKPTTTQLASRIISLSPHATELVFAAGAGGKLVGVVAHSDFPDQARSLPRIGDAARLDRERLLSLRPDLVIAWPSGNRPTDLDWLQRRGIPIFLSDPNDLPAIAADILAIGRLAGSEPIAEEAAAAFNQELRGLQSSYQDRAGLRLFYQVWPRPLFTLGRDHLINRVIALCGGRNIFEHLPQLSPQVSLEAVLTEDPDAIVAAVESTATDDPFALWRPWRMMPAVQQDALVTVPADLLHRPTPRILQGAKVLCRELAKVREKRKDNAIASDP